MVVAVVEQELHSHQWLREQKIYLDQDLCCVKSLKIKNTLCLVIKQTKAGYPPLSILLLLQLLFMLV